MRGIVGNRPCRPPVFLDACCASTAPSDHIRSPLTLSTEPTLKCQGPRLRFSSHSSAQRLRCWRKKQCLLENRKNGSSKTLLSIFPGRQTTDRSLDNLTFWK